MLNSKTFHDSSDKHFYIENSSIAPERISINEVVNAVIVNATSEQKDNNNPLLLFCEELSDQEFLIRYPSATDEVDRQARLEAAEKIIQTDLFLHRLDQKAPGLTEFQRAEIKKTCQALLECSVALRLGGL